jgi:acyl carrier protein
MTDTIESVVRELLSEIKDGLDYSTISLDTSFGDAGFDSLDTASLLLALQERFGIEISDDDADELDTIGKLVTYIKEKTNDA